MLALAENYIIDIIRNREVRPSIYQLLTDNHLTGCARARTVLRKFDGIYVFLVTVLMLVFKMLGHMIDSVSCSKVEGAAY